MSADFWAGYVSGAASIIIGNPLDLLKTRVQAGDPRINVASAESLRSQFDKLGTLVRGSTAPILTYGALNAILYASYNRTLSFLQQTSIVSPSISSPGYGDVSRLPTGTELWAAGAIAGLATFVVSTPCEIVKCRTQVEGGSGAGGSSSRSSWGITKDIWRHEGLRGFYFGGVVTSLRDSIGYGFYFWSYELSKRALMPNPNVTGDSRFEFALPSNTSPALITLFCGGLAGIITWASIFPLDVIKTRMQTQQLWRDDVVGTAVTASGSNNPRERVFWGYNPKSATASASVASPLLYPSSATRSPYTTSSTTASTVDSRQIKPLTATQIAIQTYRAEGLSAFFRGLGICSVRAFIVNAVQWGVYEWMMSTLQKP